MTVNLMDYIRNFPDFPRQGIAFKDISPLIQDAEAFKSAVEQLASRFNEFKIDIVVGIEARGYIIGAALAYKLGTGFAPIRKPGKLPGKTFTTSYELEYGVTTTEIHQDALVEGQQVLLVDDVLATGGTLEAGLTLINKTKATVIGIAVLLELIQLAGREKLAGYQVETLLRM